MGKTYIFTCDDCGHTWSSKQYKEEDDSVVDYHNGSECPKCGSENIGAQAV